MKSFLTGITAAIIGAIGFIFLFFRKGGASIEVSSKASALDKKAEAVKAEVAKLQENLGKPVEDRSLESELEYWNKEKK
jgi:hypothetical protein